ncbi:MAG: DUF4342 domain-containing protein [Clostridiales bacterium]|jgi:hypothetical protein|nr:DUF4342 domain-containing protein [Clostridiales bacterium]
MDITLEKIELVKDRTGVTYKEAKEALEAADGSVVDAIIDIEEMINNEYDSVDARNFKDSELYKKMKEIVAKGNMSRIIIKKDDEILVNFPLTAGVVGAVLVPWGVVFGIIATIGFQCEVEFVNDKGEVIDINGKVVGMYSAAKDVASKAADKSQNAFNKVMDSEKSDQFTDWVYDASDKLSEAGEKASEKFSNLMDSAADKIADASERAKDKIDEIDAKNSKLAKMAKKSAGKKDDNVDDSDDILGFDVDVDLDTASAVENAADDEDK